MLSLIISKVKVILAFGFGLIIKDKSDVVSKSIYQRYYSEKTRI